MSPGFGVMLGILGDNAETDEAWNRAKGKRIKSVSLANEKLTLTFDNGDRLIAWDHGQSCCESRYMRTDDDLASFAGSTLVDIELREAPPIKDREYGDHEVQFLAIETDGGTLVMQTHNEHNGYYGGFWVRLRYETAHVDDEAVAL